MRLSLTRKFRLLGKAPICNEKPERGISVRGVYFPLCVRCTGICIGAGIGGLMALPLIAKATLLAPIAIDVFALNFTSWQGRYAIRAITGFLCGLGLSGGLGF